MLCGLLDIMLGSSKRCAIHPFGKMISQNCKLNFLILQTNLAIVFFNFIGIMHQVHYIDNQFNLNFQPISLHVVSVL